GRATLGFGEEQREQDDRAEVGDGGPGDGELAEGRLGVAGVLEYGDDEAERRCRQRDGEEEWAAHPAGRVEDRADGEAQGQGGGDQADDQQRVERDDVHHRPASSRVWPSVKNATAPSTVSLSSSVRAAPKAAFQNGSPAGTGPCGPT